MKYLIQHGLFLFLLLPLTACQYVTMKGQPVVDNEALTKDPPRALAIMPTTDVSGHPKLTEPMRKALYSAISALPFQDRELNQVDEFVSRQAIHYGCSPENLKIEMLVDPQLSDCSAFTQIEKVSRFYLFVYSHYRIDLNFLLVDNRTRRVLYRNRFIIHDRATAIPLGIPGLLGSSIFSLWHLRPESLDEAITGGTQEIAKALPIPKFNMASTTNLTLKDVKINLPRPMLRQGDRLVIEADGTANCRSTFTIGKIAKDLPLVEHRPGKYTGIYEIHPGDNADYVLVEIKFMNAQSNEQLNYIVQQPFSIDTVPPPKARVAKARRAVEGRGMYLDLELQPWEGHGDPPAEYIVYRKSPEGQQFERIGVAREQSFFDAQAEKNKTYEYCVVTKDAAGNQSQPGTIRRFSASTY